MPKNPRDPITFHLEADSDPEPSREIEGEEPFRIAILGDFTGRSDRQPLSERKALPLDRDNFEAVLEKLDAGVELPSGRLRIREMDDFHPDRIYATYSIFDQYRGTRERLSDPDTFAEAARDVTGERPEPLRAATGRDVLADILGESISAAKPVRKADKLTEFVEKVARTHAVPREDPRAKGLVSQVDTRAAELMRAVLHHPKFQALEAAWRSLFMLIQELETGVELKVYILDVTKQELASQPETVYQKLAQRSSEWGVIAGNYVFGADDTRVLTILGRIAAKFEAPFLGQADASLLGSSPDWDAFRSAAESTQVGLALPRVLIRLPYGKNTSACEQFDFEELSGGKPNAKEMLFANPAPLCAMLLGQAFQSQGWSMRPGEVRDISGLPIYVYKDDEESVARPCGEVELSQETAEALIENGFIPMASMRNQGVVRALTFQSVHNPPRPLPGRWE